MKRIITNPYLPQWEFIPDGEPHLFGDRVYVYGSHDEAGGKSYCSGDYVCWSAPCNDLTSWSYEGVIFQRSDDPDYKHGTQRLYAPDVVEGLDGRYYLYYMSSEMEKMAVAVSDTPGGRYSYVGDICFENGERLTSETGYGMMFDPSVLIEDGKIYLYYGISMPKFVPGFPKEGYKGGFVVRLAEDMHTMITEPKMTIPGVFMDEGTSFEGHGFLEASSIRHYGDLYYLLYSSEHGHELCYATSTSPEEGFEYRGIVVSNGDVGYQGREEKDAINYLGNNHGGMLQLGDKYYIFYHRHTHGCQFSRQGCAERIFIESDGSISQVPITSYGLNEEALPAKGLYTAGIASHLSSAEGTIHFSSSVKWNEKHPYYGIRKGSGNAASNEYLVVRNMRSGAFCGFREFIFDGECRCLKTVISGEAEGTLSVILDQADGKTVDTQPVKLSNESGELVFDITDLKGTYTVFFKYEGNGYVDLETFRFY